MAATEPILRTYFGDKTFLQHGVNGTSKIYGGSFVAQDAQGYAVPLTTGLPFLGIAEEDADNTDGADGDIDVRVVAEAIVELDITGASATSVGSTVYANADDTYDLADAGSDVAIGKVCAHVSGTVCLVKIQATALQSV